MHERVLTVAALVLIACTTLLGCSSGQGYHGFDFENQTGSRVGVFRVLANGTEMTVVEGLDPGHSTSVPGFPGLTSSGDPCTVMTLIARDLQRVEVARLEGKVCLDARWVIGAAAGPTSRPELVLLAIALIALALGLVLLRRRWKRAAA